MDAARTSVHLQRAAAGEAASRAWIVERFAPVLPRVLATTRLRRRPLAGDAEIPSALPDDRSGAIPRLHRCDVACDLVAGRVRR
jgi:hypothetical protein